MKLKKIFAGIAAASMAVSAMTAVSASAVTSGATVVDFEDGDCSFVYMNLDSGSSDAVLSVEDYNGSKQLKVDVADKTAVPKVWFDLYKMMEKENVVKIKSITFDLSIVPKTEEGIVGWAGGAVGTAGSYGTQKNPSWSDKAWDGGAYNPGEVATVKVERKFILATEQYKEESESPFFGLMRWAVAADADDYVMYIDNIEFKDASGNAITVGFAPVVEETEPEATEAEPEATEAEVADEAVDVDLDVDEDEDIDIDVDVDDEVAPAPAETEAAPAPAETQAVAEAATAAPATGNVAVASIAAVMAVAGAAALVSKKRK